ncbi:hypothetical protein QYF36_025768 [Acer negundo]|nr:hypothetical protein QYF36_025768 [Acer negundo]
MTLSTRHAVGDQVITDNQRRWRLDAAVLSRLRSSVKIHAHHFIASNVEFPASTHQVDLKSLDSLHTEA